MSVTLLSPGANPSFSPEDHNISSSIARLEKTLQPKPTAVPDSPSSSHKAAGSSTGLNPELLRSLDSRKLAVNDRVSRWLDQANEPTSTSDHGNPMTVKNNVKFLQYLQLLQNMTHETSDLLNLHTQLHPNATLPLSLFTSDPTQLQLQNLKAAYSAAKTNDKCHCATTQRYQEGGVAASACGKPQRTSEKVVTSKEEVRPEKDSYELKEVAVQVSPELVLVEPPRNVNMLQVIVDDQQPTERPSEPRDKLTASGQQIDKRTAMSPERLQDSTSRRVEERDSESPTALTGRRQVRVAMEQELERERGVRERLEQELARERRKVRKLESQSGGSKGPNRATRQGQSKLEQMHQTPSQSQSQSLSQSQSRSHAKVGPQVTEPLQNAPTTSPSSVQHSSGRFPGRRYKDAPMRAAKTPRSSRSNVRYTSSISRAAKLPKPSTPSRVSDTCGNHPRLASHATKQTGKKLGKSRESKPAKVPLPQQLVGSTQLLSYSKLVISGQTSTHAHTGPSIATPNHSRAALKPLSSSDSIGCDHQCLGCKPRLKCPLITSRNFIKLLSTDKFTCTYHRRLVRWVHNRRGNFPHSSTKQRRQEEGGIDGKDVSETSHGSHLGMNENSDQISSHNQTTTLPLHFESSYQPPSPTLSSGSTSTELQPAGCTSTPPQSITHCDGSSSHEVTPCNEDSGLQYCSDDSEECRSLQHTVTSTPTVAAQSEPHSPPSPSPKAQSLPHRTATATCNQWTHSRAASRKNPNSAPRRPIGTPLTTRSSRLYSLKPKGVVLPVQTKVWRRGASPKALRDVSNRIGRAVYDYHTPVKATRKHPPVNSAKQAQVSVCVCMCGEEGGLIS